jgi:hypothetical protein
MTIRVDRLKLKRLAIAFSISLPLLLGACASPPERIEPQSVPPEKYSGLDCSELASKATEIQAQIAGLRERLKFANETATGSFAPIAWYVLWPELLYHGIAEAPKQKAEYSRLLGEHNAVSEMAKSKGCSLSTPGTGQGTAPPASKSSITQ